MDKPILIHAEHLIENAFGGPKHSLDTDNLGASGSRRRYLVFLPVDTQCYQRFLDEFRRIRIVSTFFKSIMGGFTRAKT
jgi:hypothetical protein